MLQGTGSFELKMTKLYFSFQKILFVWFISESNTAEYLTKKKKTLTCQGRIKP